MTAPLDSTSRADGYILPAEWAPQARCWMMGPTRGDTWRAAAAPAQAAFATVVMGVGAQAHAEARKLLSGEVQLQRLESNDAWMRDVDPTFTLRAACV